MSQLTWKKQLWSVIHECCTYNTPEASKMVAITTSLDINVAISKNQITYTTNPPCCFLDTGIERGPKEECKYTELRGKLNARAGFTIFACIKHLLNAIYWNKCTKADKAHSYVLLSVKNIWHIFSGDGNQFHVAYYLTWSSMGTQCEQWMGWHHYMAMFTCAT